MKIQTTQIRITFSEMEIKELFHYIDSLKDMASNEFHQQAKKQFPTGYEVFKALKKINIENEKMFS